MVRVQAVLLEKRHNLPLLIFAPPGSRVPDSEDPTPLDPVNYPVFWMTLSSSSGLLLYHRPPPGLRGILPETTIEWKRGDLAAARNPPFVGIITKIASGGYYTLQGRNPPFSGVRVVRGRQKLSPVPHPLFMTTAVACQ